MIDKKYTFSLLWKDYEKGRDHEFKTKHNSLHLYNQDILQRDMNENMITEGMQIRSEYKSISVTVLWIWSLTQTL